MGKGLSTAFLGVILVFAVVIDISSSKSIDKENCFFLNSLHYTTNGQRYWYSKENGGLEMLTNIPYDDLACKKCHTAGCDDCHKVEKNGKLEYSTDTAKSKEVCLRCHGRARSMIKIDKTANQEDVHFKMGMGCMDCHSAREMHGDGTEYSSMRQPGAMDTKCENCHENIESTKAHTVHGKKLDCKACHLRHVVSCTNCHMETFARTKKKKSIKVSGWIFLINYGGKVTSANMQNFVIDGKKTFLMFAPHMTHSIMNPGRSCIDCHSTEIIKKIKKGKIKLTWLENEKTKNLKGVIPVVKGVDYSCVYIDYKDREWKPVKDPVKPVYHYAAFGVPLSKTQLESLEEKYKE
jgi:hypothetical protein